MNSDIEKLIESLKLQRQMLVAYLKSKLDAEDLHAVQDAASDIREIDAKLSVLKGQLLCLQFRSRSSA